MDSTNSNYTSLYKDGDTSSTDKIKSIVGNNTPLINNTWGYSVDSTTYSTLTGNIYYNGEQDTKLFSGISTTPQTIKTYTSPATNNTTPIYIGVKAVSPLAPGSYTNSLTFTSTIEPDYEDTGSLTLVTEKGTTSGDIGQTITLTTDYSNAVTVVSLSNIVVNLFTGSDYITGTTSATASCASIKVNSANNGTSPSSALQLTCSVPRSYASSLTNGGTYGVAVEVLDTTSGQTFSYWKTNAYTITTKYSYSLTYNSNAGTDTVTNMPANSTGYTNIGSNTSLTISTTTPEREGYNFLGWSTIDVDPEGDDNYAPGRSITLSRGYNSMSLYAIWEVAGPPQLGNMQDASTVTACLNLPNGEMGIATDDRDDKQYFIEKLADGQCWMMQDLDLDLYVLNSDGTLNSSITASTGGTGVMGTKKGDSYVAFTNSNTNISDNSWVVSGSNRAYSTEPPNTILGWDSNAVTGSITSGVPPRYYYYQIRSHDNGDNDISTLGYGNICLPQYNTVNGGSSEDLFECVTSIEQANTQKLGNYYNWPAATAGKGTYPANLSKDTIVDSSICPAGWRLPGGGETEARNGIQGSFGNLLREENIISSVVTYSPLSDNDMSLLTGFSNTANNHKLTFLLNGYYSVGLFTTGIYAQGIDGWYWSNTSYSLGNAYRFTFTTGGSSQRIYPGTSGMAIGYGLSIRCVAN